jgi:hypothetical protein
MKILLLQSALGLCLSATPGAAQNAPTQTPYVDPALEEQRRQERAESTRAQGIAATEVGGEALGARRIDLNGASGGWDVVVRVSDDERWRVIIDRDTWTVRSKRKIEKPQ